MLRNMSITSLLRRIFLLNRFGMLVGKFHGCPVLKTHGVSQFHRNSIPSGKRLLHCPDSRSTSSRTSLADDATKSFSVAPRRILSSSTAGEPGDSAENALFSTARKHQKSSHEWRQSDHCPHRKPPVTVVLDRDSKDFEIIANASLIIRPALVLPQGYPCVLAH